MVQYIIIGIIVFLAVAYSAFRIYKTMKAANNPCAGCVGCAIREQMEQRRKNGKCKDYKSKPTRI